MAKQLTNLELDTLREIEDKIGLYKLEYDKAEIGSPDEHYYEGKYNAWLSARSLYKGYLAQVGFDLSGTYS